MSATEDRDDTQEPPLVGSGGEDVSAGLIVSGAGGRRLDADQQPGQGDLDDVIQSSRSQPEHRTESG